MKKVSSVPKKIQLGVFILVAVICVAISYFIDSDTPNTTQASMLPSFKHKKVVKDFYGFNKSDYVISSGTIKKNQFLSQILLQYKVGYATIARLANNVKGIYDVRKLRSGKQFYILNEDTSNQADYFIYVPDEFKYVVYSLNGDPCARVIYNKITTRDKIIEGKICSSLWVALENAGAPYSLIKEMEKAYDWTVDFYHLQKGDYFKLWYKEEVIGGEVVGVQSLKAGIMHHRGKDIYAIYYHDCNYSGYYDLEGRSMQKAFLSSPVKYGHISSPFNRHRYHPILHTVRPHLGTDFAAPFGTPIRSTADGVVTVASYTSGNGNYVKVRHGETYTTQYLHMSKFADGIAPGVYVEQGQTIGYVGATGLATGPHVCYRFWKNRIQVDPFELELPQPEPMKVENLKNYMAYKDEVLKVLNSPNPMGNIALFYKRKSPAS